MSDLRGHQGVARRYASSLIIKAAYVVLQVAVNILAARLVAPSAFGVFAVFSSALQVAAVVNQLGLPAYLTTRLARLPPDGRVSVRLNASAYRFILLSSPLSLAIIAALSWGAYTPGAPFAYASGVVLATIAAVLLSVASISLVFERAKGRFVISQAAFDVGRPLVFLLLVLALWAILGRGFAGVLLVGAQTVATLAYVAVFARAGKASSASGLLKVPSGQSRKVALAALPYLVLALILAAHYHLDVLMISMLLDETEAGYYRVALQFADGLAIPMAAIGLIAAPRLASRTAIGGRGLLKQLVQTQIVAVVITLPLAMVVAVFGLSLVTALFGAAFSPAAEPLTVLAWGKAAYSAVGFAGLALSMAGRAKLTTVFVTICLGLNLVANLVFVPRFGMVGAAWCTVATDLALNCLCFAAIIVSSKVRLERS